MPIAATLSGGFNVSGNTLIVLVYSAVKRAGLGCGQVWIFARIELSVANPRSRIVREIAGPWSDLLIRHASSDRSYGHMGYGPKDNVLGVDLLHKLRNFGELTLKVGWAPGIVLTLLVKILVVGAAPGNFEMGDRSEHVVGSGKDNQSLYTTICSERRCSLKRTQGFSILVTRTVQYSNRGSVVCVLHNFLPKEKIVIRCSDVVGADIRIAR